jgi:cell surface protein SprA
METQYGLDVAANFEMGKFLPEASNIKVPLFVGYSEQISNPQFDPLNPDIEWNEATRTLTREERRERLKQTRTYERRRSINLTNVRKDRGQGQKEYFWSIENFALTYAYSDQEYRDVNTEFENLRTYRGSIVYLHNPRPKEIKPFAGIGLIDKSKWFKLLKEFNFNLGFKQISMRTAVDRSYLEHLIRPNPDIEGLPPRPNYNKTFNWTNQYGFRYEISRSLRVDFNASRDAFVGEPPGRVNPKFRDEYAIWRDSVLTSLNNFGEPTDYNHTVNITYQLPLDKFPLTDWINVNTTYTAGYQWQRAPLLQDSLGNTIQNSQNITLNGQFNFVNLYNKIKYLKKINDKGRRRPGGAVRGAAQRAQPQKKEEEEGKKIKIDPLEGLARMLMTVRNGTLTYSQNSGMLLPGWGRGPNVFGMDQGFGAPGWGFIMGQQNHDLSGDLVRDFATSAAERDWLVRTESIFNPYTTTRMESINARLSLEPFQGMRVELLANRTLAENRQSFFRWNDSLQTYVNDSPQEFGNFSVSMITWPTAFSADDENFVNDIFQQVLANREVISARLGSANPNSFLPADSLYWSGYGTTNQDVVIPAFLAAYTGQDAETVNLNPFSILPLPNWDITYDGLTRLPFFNKHFRTFTVNHSYRSNFNISNFQTNLLFVPGGAERDAANNFIPSRQIMVVTISEVMRPLINFDATLTNSLIAKFEYNRDRNLSLSLANYQVTEVRGKEFVIGSGYRFKNVKLPFAVGGATPKSDLNLRVDLSLRENATVIRKMEEGQNQVTAGQNIISIRTSADYVLNQRLNIRAFYDRVINTPVISTSFPSINTNAGLSLRFTLAQ